MIYPWTHSQWHGLIQRSVADRLPHALIFSGLDGLGKLSTAKNFAQYLLCESPNNDQACQTCRSCIQYSANTHPDYTLLEPEEAGKQIKVDQIRSLIEGFSLSRHHSTHRVAIINPADAMNLSSANSLLKSLEEPPEKTLIILVTSRLAILPATIKSRCQHIHFAPPSQDMATNWLNNQPSDQALTPEDTKAMLAMANGAPLKAFSGANSELAELREAIFTIFCAIGLGKQSPLSVENQQLKQGIRMPIQWIYSWVSDLIKMNLHQLQSIVNCDKYDQLQILAKKVELAGLYRYLDQLIDALRVQHAPLNSQMVMDELMLEWQHINCAHAN